MTPFKITWVDRTRTSSVVIEANRKPTPVEAFYHLQRGLQLIDMWLPPAFATDILCIEEWPTTRKWYLPDERLGRGADTPTKVVDSVPT